MKVIGIIVSNKLGLSLSIEQDRVKRRTPENDSNFKDSESIYFLVD